MRQFLRNVGHASSNEKTPNAKLSGQIVPRRNPVNFAIRRNLMQSARLLMERTGFKRKEGGSWGLELQTEGGG